jgi:hypothetical protein
VLRIAGLDFEQVGEAAASSLAPGPLARRVGRTTVALLGREAFPIVFVAATAVGLVIESADEFGQDGWLALLGGRLVAHGLPHHDTLTAWTHGAQWVDQQWLGQLVLYGLFTGGGIRLALLAGLILTVGAVAAAMAAARWRGVSPIRVALVAGACIPVTVPAWVLRTQTLVAPLFVALLWLLVADSRTHSRRVFLAVPVLVLWANLHGSAVLAALLVAVYAVTSAVTELRTAGRRRAPLGRSGTLIAAAGLSVFASPYGFALAGYYRDILFNPGFGNYVTEWRPTTPGLLTAPFYAVLLASFWLLGRAKSLTTFERVAIVLTAVMGLATIRNTLWFGLAAIVILPRALEDSWPVKTPLRPRLNSVLGLAATGVLLVALGLGIGRPLTWLDRRWSPTAATAVSRIAAGDPSVRVYADLRYADWLLFEKPVLTGRVAVDARLELLSDAQLRRVFEIANRIGDWKSLLTGYRLIVLNPRRQGDVIRSLASEPGIREVYLSSWISIQLRTASASRTLGVGPEQVGSGRRGLVAEG